MTFFNTKTHFLIHVEYLKSRLEMTIAFSDMLTQQCQPQLRSSMQIGMLSLWKQELGRDSLQVILTFGILNILYSTCLCT